MLSQELKQKEINRLEKERDNVIKQYKSLEAEQLTIENKMSLLWSQWTKLDDLIDKLEE